MQAREKKRTSRLVTLVTGSPWLMIAIGIHVIVAAWISVLYVQRDRPAALDPSTAIAVATQRADEEPPLPEELPPIRNKIPEQRAQGELVPIDEEPLFVPTEDFVEDPELLYDETGDPTGASDGSEDYGGSSSISVGPGAGWRAGGTSPFAKRGGRGGRGGPPPGAPVHGVPVDTERAVYEGLCWLVRHQDDDGAWRAAGYARHCSGGSCLASGEEPAPYYDEGLTGLALLAFLGQGLSMESKVEIRDRAMGRRQVSGEVVKRGVRWLLERQKPDGSFSADRAFLYNEAIVALALSEAHGLARNRTVAKAAQRAVDFLVAAQKVDEEGRPWGWRYGSRRELDLALERGEIDAATHAAEVHDADLSVTCWAVMALKSAAMAGLEVPPEALAGALAFAEHTAARDGLAGYQRASQAGDVLRGRGDHFEYHTGTMSALNMLVRTFVRHDAADPFLETAARRLAADPPRAGEDGLSIDYYYWYHATLALNQFDGPESPRPGAGAYWKPWNTALVETLLALQDRSRERDVCSRGGWLADDRWATHGGHALYATALNVLTLEVYYRYENAFGALPITTPELPSASRR